MAPRGQGAIAMEDVLMGAIAGRECKLRRWQSDVKPLAVGDEEQTLFDEVGDGGLKRTG